MIDLMKDAKEKEVQVRQEDMMKAANVTKKVEKESQELEGVKEMPAILREEDEKKEKDVVIRVIVIATVLKRIESTEEISLAKRLHQVVAEE